CPVERLTQPTKSPLTQGQADREITIIQGNTPMHKMAHTDTLTLHLHPHRTHTQRHWR
ncbi:hypothetical protein NDU88_001269, partial [Pleurodeles waltl]